MLSEIKPYISAIVFSPALLMLGIGIGLGLLSKTPKLGKAIAFFSTILLWIISTPLFSFWLSHNLLTQYNPTTAEELKAKSVHAIVVLGGGVETCQPNGIQQLKPTALDRLRHGIELSRQTGIPMLVTGGKGWGADVDSENEAEVLNRVALEAFQYQIRWTESDSRDTRGNARNSKELLSKQGIQKIALVTHTWHIPRSMKAFEEVGFEVIPAPLGYIGKKGFDLLSLLPNVNALDNTLTMFKEIVGLLLQSL